MEQSVDRGVGVEAVEGEPALEACFLQVGGHDVLELGEGSHHRLVLDRDDIGRRDGVEGGERRLVLGVEERRGGKLAVDREVGELVGGRLAGVEVIRDRVGPIDVLIELDGDAAVGAAAGCREHDENQQRGSRSHHVVATPLRGSVATDCR